MPISSHGSTNSRRQPFPALTQIAAPGQDSLRCA